MTFDMFSAVGVGATEVPYFQGLDNTGLGLTYMTPADATTNGRTDSSAGTLSDMFNPPLHGDSYMMQTMQALGDGGSNSFDWQSNSELLLIFIMMAIV